MDITDIIDQVYLINLDSRTDRLESAIETLNTAGIYLFKKISPNFDAFDESSILSKERQSVKDSHVRCVKDAIENNYNNIIIFEDDIVLNQDDSDISENIDKHMNICLDFIKNNNYSIFYFDNIFGLGRTSCNEINEISRYNNSNGIISIPGKAYTHSYAINKSAFIYFIEEQSRLKNCGNDGVSSLMKCTKYMYSNGIFDQKIGYKSDNNFIIK